MELNSTVVDTPPRPAATVMLLRDAPEGLEVFLLKRHSESDVLGGAYVFPGGKVDRSDCAQALLDRLDQSPEHLHATLNEADIEAPTAAGLFIAAMREVYEESGVLFARTAHQSGTHFVSTGTRSPGQEAPSFEALLAAEQMQLAVSSLLPWSRWITPRVPSVMRRRFDTRFFVAMAPPDQVAAHDNYEATESLWVKPRTALEQFWQGHIEMAAPQIMSLAHLSRFASAAEVLADARARPPALICPEPHDLDGVRVVCYPGDVLHSVRQRAMPGPSRLLFRNKRFEPLEGFDAFFA